MALGYPKYFRMESKLPVSLRRMPQTKTRIPPVRACLAGLVAGVVATVVQLLCWWAGGLSPVDMLLRDSRLAAAIVLGPQVLPPPIGTDLRILAVASAIHVLLSAAYGMVQAPLAARAAGWAALPAGALFGALLFWLNMYGFTRVFPWFVASRDWATLVAHLAFGISALWLSQRWRVTR